MDEENQSIEFLKIQLMEKDSKLSELQANFKKIQFKHNREVKELKIAEDRAKSLLADEKKKIDKITKQANENQEQNTLLNIRITELKEEKQKEVESIRHQYNSIKEEVRSYERILPTHTFLNQLGAKIDQLPTYQDIFVNLKEKTHTHDHLNQKFQAYRFKTEEDLITSQANQEVLKQKKIDAEKNLKVVVNKIQEYQSQISDIKLNQQHLIEKIQELQDLVLQQTQKINNVQAQNREYSQKIDQIIQSHNAQLQAKEEEIRAMTFEEFQKYEQQIESLQSRSQIKQNMYVSQISILEEENTEMHSTLQREKEKYQENYIEIKEIINDMKMQQEFQKRCKMDIQEKNFELENRSASMKAEIQRLQTKVKELEKNFQEQLKKHLNSELLQKQRQIHFERVELEMKEQQNALVEKNKFLSEENQRYFEQNRKISQLNTFLTSELEEVKNQEIYLPQNHSLELPNSHENEGQRRKSSFMEKRMQRLESAQECQIIQNKIILEATKQSTNPEVLAQEEINKKERQAFIIKIQDLNIQIYQYQSKISSFQSNEKILTLKIDENAKKYHQLEEQIKHLKNSINEEEKQRQKLVKEIFSHKDTIGKLNKKNDEKENSTLNSQKKQSIMKTQIEALEGEKNLIANQLKKQKEAHSLLKEQMKNIKYEHHVLSESNSKYIKQLINEIQSFKEEREKNGHVVLSKDKNQIHQIAVLKNQLQKERNSREKIKELKLELENQIVHSEKLQKDVLELHRQIYRYKKQIETLEEEIRNKDRQNQLINQSLERQRKERTLITVPSLQALHGEMQIDQQNFKMKYNEVAEKEITKLLLEREVSDLKEEIESQKIIQASKIEGLEAECTDYIQQIIKMKMKVAETEMRASEKEYLYVQIKKKMQSTLAH